jgi:hypothetical protein
MAEAPDDFLNSVWDAAEMAWYNDNSVNPWRVGTEQHAVWALAQKAAAELFAWEQTDEARVQDELEEQKYWEIRQADVRDNDAPDADHVAKYLRFQVDHVLRFLGMNAPTAIINGSRFQLLKLANELANIPTQIERKMGRTPMKEPTDAP